MMRIALGFVLVCEGLLHWRYSIELYSTAGPAMPIFVRQIDDGGVDTAGERNQMWAAPTRVETVVPLPIPRPATAVIAQTVLLLAAISVVLGWHTRTSLVMTFLLAAWLGPLDLPVTFGKQSVIALHLLILLAFSGCGAVCSIDALSDGYRAARCRLSILAPRRLMQILVCCVYLGAAITKLKTPSFVGGDLLTFSLLDDHWGSGRLGLWLTTLPHVSLLLSLATLFFEMLFPFLVWVPRLRRTMLGLAVAFHAAMGCLLSVGIFPVVMFTALLSFVEERDLRVFARLGEFLLRPQGNTSGNSNSHPIAHSKKMLWAVLHLTAAATLTGCGLYVQVHYDWYGVFGRRPAPALSELVTDDVSEMLAERLPAYEDYFHRVELGSRFGGNQMFGASRKFKIGQRAYVLAQLILPHPSFELEGLLIAPDGREAARFTHRIDAGVGYAINGFEFTSELPTGNYRIILQADDFTIAERQFELVP